MSGPTIHCPSGLVVTLREFKVTDENLLANRKSIRHGTGVTNLLGLVTERVDDPGHYALRDKDKKHDDPWLDWSNVLQGDRMVVLKENRVATWGPVMTDKRPCQNCRAPVSTDFSLDDLDIVPLPESSVPHLIDPEQAPIRVKLPRCEVTMGFRLLRGRDEKSLERIQKRSKETLSSSLLLLRTVSIEGVSEAGWPSFIENLGGYDSSYYRAAFDAADCGLEQEWGFECDDCGHLWTADVKLREDFLFPTYRGKISTMP